MTKRANPVRIAVIGVGSMGRNHARILSSMERQAELVAVVDANRETVNAIANAAETQGFTSVEEAIAIGLDAAVVAVPTEHHHATVTRLLEAGVHVLVEKPIAATLTEAKDLIARAEAAKRILTVGHVERFNPSVQSLRTAIGHEPIISIAISRVGPFPPRINDVGIVIDLGVHDIDLIRWIGNAEIVERQALLTRSRGKHEDIAFLQFRLESGALAHINTNWLTPFKERKISVSTATRFIVCDLMLRTVTEFSGFDSSSGHLLGPGSYASRSLNVPFVEPLRAELEAFITAVRNGSDVVVTAHDGLRSLEVALDCINADHN